MAGSINKAIILGNLGKDPEIRTTQDGSKLASFSVATSEYWKDKTTGERKERTEWHRVVVYNQSLAEICEKYLRKGSKVYVEGQIQTRKFQDRNGVERTTTEIIVSGFKCELTLLDPRSADTSAAVEAPAADSNMINDDIPF